MKAPEQVYRFLALGSSGWNNIFQFIRGKRNKCENAADFHELNDKINIGNVDDGG